MNHLQWRVCALLCCAALAGSAPLARAQGDLLSPGSYPGPSKTPEEAALNFYGLLAFVGRAVANPRSTGEAPPDQATMKKLLGSVPRAQFGALFAGPNGQKALPLLAEQARAVAKSSHYNTQVRGTSGNQTIVSVAPSTAPQGREVVVLAQDGGFRVDVKATYGRWNNLSGPQLDRAWLSLTGLTSLSQDPFESLRKRVRENARRASCLSNMRQMMLGVLQYEQDHDDPDAKTPSESDEKMPPARKWIDAILPYVLTEEAFQCPSLTATTGGKGYGYAFNQNLSGVSMAAIKSPSTTVAIYETSNPARNWFGPGTGRAYRHSGGSNIAFADGHVKWFAKGEEPGVSFKP